MDLARDAAMAAESRGKLGEHVQACPQCAVQVASERSLTAGLRTLAGSSKNESAPPRVEAALKAAFRKQVMPSAAPATAFTFSDFAIRSGISLAAAAVVLVSFLARVKLPRSMLASFGIAVNMEIGDEPVRADLVLGNDGVPRSIRLIDNSLQSR
jgi:anti-sigma factor RsiW